ncbi:unnamed protein product [Mytilus coruscus]|uniref:Ig-like domain-containing protein n=1 Tax=Mytilus coruscus TaxID=42192 RepID=A0A6J8AEZ8_MYTCO|nr:unnamed protein product [Mytilus coruscus]
MRSLFPVKYVRWQKNEHDIHIQIDKHILNDSKLSLTIKNLSKADTGTYECIVSNWLGLNNTTVDRCISYLSALHTRMTWVQTLHKFEACRKEDENGITVTVHAVVEEVVTGNDGLVRSVIIRTNSGRTSRPIVKLYPLEINEVPPSDEYVEEPNNEEIPTRTLPVRKASIHAKERIKSWTQLPKEYKPEEKKKGDKVTMKPKTGDGKETMKSLPEDIKFVVWFYKTADILRVVKPDQHGGITFGDIDERVVKQGPHEDINEGAVKQGPQGDINDRVEKQGPHEDINDRVVILGPPELINDGVVKQDPHEDINDGVVKKGPHEDINDGVVKPGPHGDINDIVVTQGPHEDINDGAVNQGPHKDINDGVVKQGPHEDINDGVVNQGPHKDINDGVVNQGPHKDINDGVVKHDLHEDMNDEVVKHGPHEDINDGVVNQGPHKDINDGVVNQGPHKDINDGVVKHGPHEDINDEVVKQGPHEDINDGGVKPDQHSDINDGAFKPDQHCNITDERTQDKHALVFNTAVSHHGQYVCFIVTANGNIISNGWKLKVVLQESVNKEIMKHRKDNSYVKTAHEEKAMKSLENNGFVVIVGREGTGKSKICLQLASLFEQKDYLPFNVDQKSLKTTQIADLKSTKVMFIIDHSVHNPNKLDQMLDQLPEVSDIGHRRIIITCRHLQPLVRKILQRYKLYNDKALIELDKILTVDKRKILGVHMEVNNIAQSKSVVLGEDVVTEIIKTEPFLGFPLMASKFCSQTENLRKGEKYFTNPPKFLVDEIRDLYHSALRTKEPQLMKEYFILVYIATDERLCFDVSVSSASRFFQVNMLIYGSTKEVKSYEMSCIKDAADKLVANNKYIINCDDHAYRFIHPYVAKAIFLSSEESLLHYFIENGDVEDIIEFVRSFLYTVTDDELVLKLKDENMYNILCERLTFRMTEKPELEKKIGHYIYDCFIKLQDTSFLSVLLSKLACDSSIRKIQKESSAKQVIMKESMNVKDDRQTVIHVNQAPIGDNKNQNTSEKAIIFYSPPQMIAMIEHLTRTGKDSWIYREKTAYVPDFVVLYGLIVGCKNKFLSDAEQNNTFQIILNIFTKNLKNKSFRLKCCTPMDTFDNKFCHFLTLFNESESFLILERLIEGLNEHAMKDTIIPGIKKKTERKNILKVKNIFKESPMQTAAYLGKAKLFTYFSSESKKKKEKKEKLFEVVKHGMEVAFVTFNFTNLNFDHDLRKSICVGDKDAYDDIMAALKKW